MRPVLPVMILGFFRKISFAGALAACVAAGTAHAACVNPAGDEGKIIYNDQYRVLQYCDDTNWVAIGALPSYNAPTNGMLYHWPFNEGTGGTSVDSVAGNVATLVNGSVWGTGKFGSALNLSGTRHATLATTANIVNPSAYTKTAWINPSACAPASYNNIFSHHSHAFYLRDGCYLGAGHNALWESNDQVLDSAPLSLNQWYFVAVTYNASVAGGTMKLYRDGVLVSTRTSYPQNTASAAQTIGSWHGGFTFQGLIDDVRIYNRELSQVEIEAIAGIQAGDSGLVAHWRMDEPTGTTLFDSVGNINGSYVNGPTSIAGQVGLGRNFVAASGHHALVPHNAALNNPQYTLAAWVYSNTAATGSVVRKVIDKGGVFTMNWDHNSFPTSCEHNNGGVWRRTGVGPLLEAGKWYHLACTYDGSEFIMYVDGQEVSRGSGLPGPPNTSGAVYIASRNAVEFFNGILDDIRIYNRALLPQEIAGIMRFCSSPSAEAGSIRYNADRAVMQYCNGREWVAMGPDGYAPVAVSFDGTNDWIRLATDFTGNANSNYITGSFWFRTDPASDGNEVIYSGGNSLTISVGGDNRLYFSAREATNTTNIVVWRTPASVRDNTWRHVMFSIDMTNQAASRFYVDGAHVDNFTTFTQGAGPMRLTYGAHAVGDYTNDTSSKFTGALADLWLAPGVYVDLSVAGNRALFRNMDGEAVFLGTDGSLPTGNPPILFLSGVMPAWHTNKGTGGGFTLNGALEAVDSPSGECTNPSGIVGNMIYNANHRVLQYCNGFKWVAAGK